MRARTVALLFAGVLAAVLVPATAANAHPLGNFTINQHHALDLYPDRIDVTATVDLAELPTLQEKSTMDGRTACASLAGNLIVTVNGHRLQWTVGSGVSFELQPGSAGLPTSRLTCPLSAPASLDRSSTVDIDNRYRSDRIGWRELTAKGHGVRLVDPPIPSVSVSDNLRAYPQDLLSSPLDVRTAHLVTEPGDGAPAIAAGGAAAGHAAAGRAAAGGAAAVAPSRPAEAGGLTGWSVRTERSLQGLVGGRHFTPLVGMLAVLLAIALGAGHAALPGHGKTVMAVYLTGQAGRVRDALGVAATVTLTHTGAVLVLGLLLTSVASLAGETVLGWLGVVSGVTVAAVGAGMLVAARRRLRRTATALHHHDQDHHHHHDHHHDGHPHDHGHGHGHGHSHGHSHDRPSRLSIVGMGVAGGLVPSPSALIILLGAIGLGRTGFGVLLVVGYGLGMAATLTAAGLALVALRRRWAGRLSRAGTRWARLSGLAPAGTAALVLLVGVGLAGRALAGMV